MRFDKKIKLLIIITDRKNSEKTTALLNDNGYELHDAMLAKGTARDDFSAYLGLGEPEKAIITCMLDEARAKEALKLLSTHLLNKKGGGIAFTIPISGASNLEVARLAVKSD